MTQQEFIHDLRKFLQRLPADEQAEIVADYEEHFRIGAAEGRPEEQTANALGSPMEIARSYYTQRAQQEGDGQPVSALEEEPSVFRSLLLLAALFFFNLIFVLGPWVGVAGIVLGFLAAGVGTTFAGGAAITSSLAAIIQGTAAADAISGLFLGVGLGALGLLLLMLGVWLSRWFIILTARYVRWNFEVIRR